MNRAQAVPRIAILAMATFLVACGGDPPPGAHGIELALPPVGHLPDESNGAATVVFHVPYSFAQDRSYSDLSASEIAPALRLMRASDCQDMPLSIAIGASPLDSGNGRIGEFVATATALSPGAYVLEPADIIASLQSGGIAGDTRWPASALNAPAYSNSIYVVGSCPHASWISSSGADSAVTTLEVGLSEPMTLAQFSDGITATFNNAPAPFSAALSTAADGSGETSLVLTFDPPIPTSTGSFEVVISKEVGGGFAGDFLVALSCAPVDCRLGGGAVEIAPDRDYLDLAEASRLLQGPKPPK